VPVHVISPSISSFGPFSAWMVLRLDSCANTLVQYPSDAGDVVVSMNLLMFRFRCDQRVVKYFDPIRVSTPHIIDQLKVL
jgi:hypothetical protein